MWKRAIYGLPVMDVYRNHRTRQLASRHRDHPLGFKFAGRDTFFSDSWETSERAVVDEQLARATVFVDIGANQGIYTCQAAARGLSVAAIEPERGNQRFLYSNIAANAFEVEVFPVALSDRPGVTVIYGDGDTASLVPGWGKVRESFAQHVPTNTIDNLFADRWTDQDLFIKVDVEGFELTVLSGAARMLRRARKPVWMIETFPTNYDEGRTANPQFATVFETMFAAGYGCHRIDTRAPVTMDEVRQWTARPGAFDLGGSNYLFAEASSS